MSAAVGSPAATVGELLPVPEHEWVAQRHRNVAAFLADRNLDAGWLAGLMRERVGEGLLLLTSSPVHGLSNPTSDLDFIRIQAAAIHRPRIAAKIFERGHHLEVVSFSAGELERNLAYLETLARLSPAETVAGFRSWDQELEPRRKQTERIVNGITLDGDMPYRGSLPALSAVWARASLQAAIDQVFHLCLSEAAGEERGRVGYAVNALLHLADALLSVHGDVYTTRKWYLLRWARAALAATASDPAVRDLAAAVDDLRLEITEALSRPQVRLSTRYAEVATRAARTIAAVTRVTATVELADGVEYRSLLPGAGLLLGAGSSVVVSGRAILDGFALDLHAEPRVDAETGAALLRALRARVARVVVAYDADTGRAPDAAEARP